MAADATRATFRSTTLVNSSKATVGHSPALADEQPVPPPVADEQPVPHAPVRARARSQRNCSPVLST